MVFFVIRSILSILLLSFFFAAEVQAGLATFAVGSDSTFINVFTRESQRNGSTVGRVRVDLRRIEALCRDGDRAFEGFVRLVPAARPGANTVVVECLRRADDSRVAALQTEGPVREP